MNASTGYQPQKIRGFSGLWKRGSEEDCPLDHLTDCYNCSFPGKDQVNIREPFGISSSGLIAGTAVSYDIARVIAGARLLTLSSTSILYDETNAVTLGAFPGADDFVCLNIYGRSYIALKQMGKAWGLSGTANTFTDVAGSTSIVDLTSGNVNSYALNAGIIINGVQCNVVAYTGSTTLVVDYDFGSMSGVTYQFSSLFVYNGTTFYPASGHIPLNSNSSTSYAITTWGSGYNTPGQHQVMFAYQYQNGYLSAPVQVPYQFANNVLGTGFTITFSDTPPPNVVARVLIATQALDNAIPANIVGGPTFFIPNGVIPVADTTFNFSFYDTDLLTSSDYLFNISQSIMGASALRFYNGRLVVIGQYPFPDNILVSDQLIPESMNAITGIINMPVDYGLNTSSTGWVIRDVLYLVKPNSTYSTQDNGGDPSTWSVSAVDTGLGCWNNGISTYESAYSGQDILDTVLVVTARGLMLFNGSYSDPPLTYKIESIWELISPNYFYLCQIAHDIVLKRVYILVPLIQAAAIGEQITSTSGAPNVLLMMDYKEGLTSTTVKWSVWFTGPFGGTQIIKKMRVENFTLNYGTPIPIYQLSFCVGDPCIYALYPPAPDPLGSSSEDEFNSGFSFINQAIITSPLSFGDGISVYTLISLMIYGAFSVVLSWFTRNRQINPTGSVLRTFNLSAYLGSSYYNLQTGTIIQLEGIQICLQANPASSPSQAYFHLIGIDVYGKLVFNMRPQKLEVS